MSAAIVSPPGWLAAFQFLEGQSLGAVAEFVASQGGWGAWLLTVAFFIYLIMSGKWIHIKQHEARIEDLKEQLKAERADSEFWREAATLSSEMGAIIAKAKVSLSGRRQDDAK